MDKRNLGLGLTFLFRGVVIENFELMADSLLNVLPEFLELGIGIDEIAILRAIAVDGSEIPGKSPGIRVAFPQILLQTDSFSGKRVTDLLDGCQRFEYSGQCLAFDGS